MTGHIRRPLGNGARREGQNQSTLPAGIPQKNQSVRREVQQVPYELPSFRRHRTSWFGEVHPLSHNHERPLANLVEYSGNIFAENTEKK